MGASEEGEVNVTFSAQISQFVDKLGEASKAMKESFSSVTDAISVMGETFAWFTGLLAGGQAFQEAINATSQLVDTTREFMEVTGMAADRSGAIIAAMHEAGGSAEQYEGTLRRLEMRLVTNTAAYDRYGITYKDANGQLLSAETVMQNVIARLSDMSAGTERGRAGFELLGRGAGDVSVLMRAMGINLEEITKLQDSLGLTVTQSMIDMRDSYRATLVQAKEVVEGLWNAIGSKLMPQLTIMGKWFVDQGPGLVQVMSDAVALFGQVWHIAFSGAREIVDDLIGVVEELVGWFVEFEPGHAPANGLEFISLMIRACEKYVVSLKFAFELLGMSAAAAATEAGLEWEAMAEILRHPLDSLRNIDQALIATRGEITKNRDLWKQEADAAAQAATAAKKAIDDRKIGGGDPAKPGGGDDHAPPHPNPALDNARLAAARAALEAAAALEKEFNSEELAELEDLYKQGYVDTQDYYARKTQLEEDALTASIELKQKESDETVKLRDAQSAGSAQWLQYQAKNIGLLGQITVLEAQRAEVAVRNGQAIVQAEQKVNAALVQTRIDAEQKAAADELAAEQAKIKQMQDMRLIDADQAFTMQTAAENKSYAAEIAALAAKRALIAGSTDEVAQQQAKADADAEAAERAHQQKLTEISNQASLDRNQYAVQAFDSVQTGFQTLFESLGHNLTNFSGAFRAFGQSIINTFITMCAQMAAKWIAKEIIQTEATIAGNELRTAADWLGAAESVAATVWASIVKIGALAWQVAAEVYSAIAGIPYVGPFLAPVMAVAAGAEVGSWVGRVASAEGGWWQVPGDTFANIHKDEMVMPAPLAQGMRDMINGGGGNGDVHIHAIPMPGGFWAIHQDALVDVFKRAKQTRRL